MLQREWMMQRVQRRESNKKQHIRMGVYIAACFLRRCSAFFQCDDTISLSEQFIQVVEEHLGFFLFDAIFLLNDGVNRWISIEYFIE